MSQITGGNYEAALPTQPPTKAAIDVVNFFRGKDPTITKAQAFEAGWNVAGYGGRIGLGNPDEQQVIGESPCCTEEAGLAALEAFGNTPAEVDGKAVATALPIPWPILLKFLLNVVLPRLI